jgi:hypothetical protein
LTGKDSYDFNHLQKEYSEARQYLDILKERFENAREIRRKMGPAAAQVLTGSPRKALMLALHHYTAAGLHSVKVRRRENLRERNIAILQEVIFHASIYDPAFIPFFIEYNRSYLRSYESWRSEQQFTKGRKLFLSGLNRFLDYQKMGNPGSARSATAYINEALQELSQVTRNSYQQSIIQFAGWILKELDNRPVQIWNG